MGNGGSIDWDPRNSSAGTAITKAGAGVSLNPWEAISQPFQSNGLNFDSDWRNSTLGQAFNGNFEKAGQDIGHAIGNSIDPVIPGLGTNIQGTVLAANDVSSGRTGAQGRQNQKQNELMDEAQKAQQAQQAIQRLQAQQAAAQKNTNYLNNQAAASASNQAEDAFIQARNAARKAKGTQLFGAYNG